ncbi:GAF domain-containing protein [Aquabacterium sp.]|uniref:GAF domain-containing protein n=1 Tax=Aquabacterium sp. TaxID=1872578 RepID=UPI002C4DF42A|nr:GAF domain-containing protein [Aquabacterium sp.]HSW03461.1 GAF domain-containing protein [Aquabacterium sp.]
MHNTFIRVAEVWEPSADGALLELAGGLYGAAPAFGALSQGLCFGRAEGLPGHAWDEGRPILLERFEHSFFRRTAAAQAAGLGCALALPVFIDERLTCVVVLLCGEAATHQGAIELWHNDPRLSGDLALKEGYFGKDAKQLETLSRDAWLPRGSGLPGQAWQREAVVFMDQLEGQARFLRAQTAAAAGIVRALALPCSGRGRENWVLSLLSSSSTPIARRVESWLPDAAGKTLQRGFGHCESAGALPGGGELTLQSGGAGGVIGLAHAHGRAGVLAQLAAAPSELAGEIQRAGLSSMLAVPVVAEGVVSEVLALYF